LLIKRQEVFNLEKEAKIINPHPMDCNTLNQTVYKAHLVNPQKKERTKVDNSNKPMVCMSSYAKYFPNWKNGQGDIFHEKHP